MVFLIRKFAQMSRSRPQGHPVEPKCSWNKTKELIMRKWRSWTEAIVCFLFVASFLQLLLTQQTERLSRQFFIFPAVPGEDDHDHCMQAVYVGSSFEPIQHEQEKM